MSNINNPNKKSFTSMFGTKAPTSTAQSSNTEQRGSFFKSFVKTEDKDTKPGSLLGQNRTDAAQTRPAFSAAKPADTGSARPSLTSPIKKSSVNIPFDISKLTLEEKIAILEKINADIENESKVSEKRMIQPASSRLAPQTQTAPAKPTASQLFKSSLQTQNKDASSASKSLFANKTAAEGGSMFGGSRPSLVRRTTGSDSSANEIKITNEEFIILRDFLYDQCGIYVGENRKYLMENRLNARLRELGLHNFSEYHNYLRYDKNRMAELNELFINMTTNETSFFRNNVQLDVFRDKVLSKVIADQRAKGEKKIHIWSAGCSSGEEPYTIAIILLELLKGEINDWNIKITANDLSLAMLAIARKGVYSEYALRTTPPEIIDKYFTKEGKNYKIIPAAQRLVQFSQINLARSDQIAKVERSHIVFCRNVIIYFDDAMKKHVINAFYDNLLPGGYLLIGHSESLHNISRTFKPEHHPGAIIYCKQS